MTIGSLSVSEALITAPSSSAAILRCMPKNLKSHHVPTVPESLEKYVNNLGRFAPLKVSRLRQFICPRLQMD